MSGFKVGDRVRYAKQFVDWKDTDRLHRVFEVTAVDEDGSKFLAEGDAYEHWSYMYKLVEPAGPDVAKLQEKLNEAAFAFLKSVDMADSSVGSYPSRVNLLAAAQELQAALHPSERELLYVASNKGSITSPPTSLTQWRSVVGYGNPAPTTFHPWDGTRFGEPITGDELAELLAGDDD